MALPIFSSDPLSSVAYASEATLVVLVAASLSARRLLIPISLAIAALLVLVVLSYRQTVRAYPTGGGAYVVASENLGRLPGLVAAASLLVDSSSPWPYRSPPVCWRSRRRRRHCKDAPSSYRLPSSRC